MDEGLKLLYSRVITIEEIVDGLLEVTAAEASREDGKRLIEALDQWQKARERNDQALELFGIS